MSTVGKVLCALIALPILGWLWLASDVAEFDRAYGKVEKATIASIESAEQEIVTTRSDIVKTRSQVAQVQNEKVSRLTSARALISLLYHEVSSAKETLDRYSLQYQAIQAAEKAAQDAKAKSIELLAQTNRELTAARAELAQARERNTADRATLEELRQSLRDTLAQNLELVEARTKAATAGSNPAARAVPALTAPVSR